MRAARAGQSRPPASTAVEARTGGLRRGSRGRSPTLPEPDSQAGHPLTFPQVKTYLLIDAETREPLGEHTVSDTTTLQAGSRIVQEVSGEQPQTWEVLGTLDGEDEQPTAFVRPAAGA
jgi:hypothetical protein